MQPIESMSFEDALRELEAIVRRLEEGKTNLEDAMEAYERGAALRAHCEKKLKDARLRVEQAARQSDGNLVRVVDAVGADVAVGPIELDQVQVGKPGVEQRQLALVAERRV